MTAEATAIGSEVQGSLLRKPGRIESLLGPEWYRLLRGIFVNPLSVTGLVILGIFIGIAIFAPVLAPPVSKNANPYMIPRDGFRPEPKPPGTE